ncbi:membrane protein insertase YidC [Acetobacter pasteurianus]|uniref:Membrane protein insertase YidC n=2 Tax=Acetobacter pasteurianus TaxID=438 RepID=C7JEI5_ACEP3|nr:membrane protein insertase YidC [Acetobacter pasteurianus]ASC04809.1 Membrane protein insertase YidC [Acetobacter pasteurianus subsp. pasteurianus]BAH98815.1 translocase inner membrane component YidC [Acetobacter pasteurianus IFO 3283-01]BAI01866.1 translocase inner membrane component YidC [Acetobacter pasteurianus IFO 3283-03]BAI04914.1 translocase inner membrane component YidC [Acetobacter pasteurianus IFO 3283-07]BAI07961.1 translocase inner membrane component YidC [Acetobacter pasteuria
MDPKRLILATALSALVLIGYDYLFPQHQPVPPPQPGVHAVAPPAPASSGAAAPAENTQAEAAAPVKDGPETRVAINAPAVQGTLNLRGARLDDLVLKHYRETVKPDSPDVRVLNSASTHADYVDFGWRAPSDVSVRLPDANTLWKASGTQMDAEHPLTLSWDNGQGLTFDIRMSVDQNYMFTISQQVHNSTGQAVALYPFYRVNRGYTPEGTGGMLVHEGPISVIDGRLNEGSYKTVRTGGVPPDNIAWSHQGTGGWAGITDKYWLMAVLPDQNANVIGTYGFQAAQGAYQVGFTATAPVQVAAGQTASTEAHVFAGAKEVRLLEQYEKDLHVPMFWKAVDFGWLSFLTRPVFFVLDWLNEHLGSFGLALLTFTVIVKVAFLPLTIKQMRMTWKTARLKPQVDLIRSRLKDDPMAMQQQIMALYRQENVNLFGGFLPLLIQAPVFWCLYKDLYVTIEMRHAPFVGWVKDLSAPDPTNLFNLFGLVPFDPTHITPFLALGAWPIMYGATLFLMQKVSSSSANMDPSQQKVMMFIPLLFTFFMARQPVGLVIYYCWSNILTAVQQVIIISRLKAADAKPQLVKPK